MNFFCSETLQGQNLLRNSFKDVMLLVGSRMVLPPTFWVVAGFDRVAAPLCQCLVSDAIPVTSMFHVLAMAFRLRFSAH